MAAGKSQTDHDEIRVHVEQTQREVLPAMELETKEIKMCAPLPAQAGYSTVPSIVMTSVENGKTGRHKTVEDVDRIVGITSGPMESSSNIGRTSSDVPPLSGLEQEATQQMERFAVQTPSSPKLGSRHTAEESHSILEKTENLMEFFEDKEKKQRLTVRSAKKTPRTPSPSPIRQSAGLDHLDNLVKLMEQLGNLRDENLRLKTRCDYLESTKSILIAKSTLNEDDSPLAETFNSNSLPRTRKGKTRPSQIKSTTSNGGERRIVRPRLPSAEDARCLDFDIGGLGSEMPQRSKFVFKRSFSTGSLDVPSDIVEQSEDDLHPQRLSDPFEDKTSSKISKSPETKRKSKFSKWAKVKKVLNKQQLSENISSGLKSIKGLGKGAYLRYGGSIAGRELTVPSHSVAESRSVDSGVGSGMDGESQDVRRSTSSNEPPSPTPFIERHIDVPTPQVEDCEGIWLGPPEWIQKEREKEKELLKPTNICESLKKDPGELEFSHSVSPFDNENDQFLHLPIPRRQSSPLLLDSGDEEEEVETELKRSSSCKEQQELKLSEEICHKSESKSEKKYRIPWGKMKNIIHTRKDSVKKPKAQIKGTAHEIDPFGFEEVSETDIEVLEDIKYVHDSYLEGPVSRSTPKPSPVVFRQKQQDKSSSNSPPASRVDQEKKVPTTAAGFIDGSALIDQSAELSEGLSYEGAGAVSPEFLKKLEEWERLKTVKGSTEKHDNQKEEELETESSGDEEEISVSPDQQRQTLNMQQIQRNISDSFSRKMEEWEKQKYRATSTPMTHSKDLKPKRTKSKKTKEEKEKEKIEKLREREIIRVEREQQKLEKERIRIEKERLKALEREAKIEKMKGRLSQPDMEAKLKDPILGPLTDYKVTSEFARKVHEWEVMKGKDTSTAMYLEAKKRSLAFSQEYENATNMLSKQREGIATSSSEPELRKASCGSDDIFVMEEPDCSGDLVRGKKPSALTLLPCYDTPETSPMAPVSEDSSLDDNTTETMESMTQANIASLEKANRRLLEELRRKEMEYNALQQEVQVLNNQLLSFRNEHAFELDLYKQQLMDTTSPGLVTFDTKHMSQTLMHLEDKIGEIKKFGEQLAMSMEGAAVGKFQTVEGEESINSRLVDLLDKMRLLLQQATISGENTLEEVSQKSSALHSFEKLYSQAMQLQMQMNNLRLSQLERNKEIMNMKRHLLLQEANNLVLQADVTRREAELLYYKEYSQKRQPIKRWNTYSGREERSRDALPSDSSTKYSIFQRVQRLRSIRPLISSTTDSDSDVPIQSPPRRESPRVRKRESPKTRKRESPKDRRKEPHFIRQKDIPSSPENNNELERSLDRKEEYVLNTSVNEKPDLGSLAKKFLFPTTITLPTANMSMPKDVAAHEIRGAHRKERKGELILNPVISPISEHPESITDIHEPVKITLVQTTVKGTEPKFPELLIPEWKKQTHGTKIVHLQKMQEIDQDDMTDIDQDSEKTNAKESTILPVQAELSQTFEKNKRQMDQSFDSSETSEDTLKLISPEVSPAPNLEQPKFPTEISAIRHDFYDAVETVSDPGQSRPNSMIRVSVETHGTPMLLRKIPPISQSRGRQLASRINMPILSLKQIRPAQELLEESQRYRSGHSIYLTRILKRYPMKIECRSRTVHEAGPKEYEKDCVREGYVKQIVKQLSREGTPDSRGSPKLGQKGVLGSPKSDFVSQIVRKLSSPTVQSIEKATIHLHDLTNDGQVNKLKQSFDSPEKSPKRHFSESSGVKKGDTSQTFESSSSSSTLTFSHLSQKTDSDDTGNDISSRATYSSMPMLSLEEDELGRERSSTTSSPASRGQSKSPKDSPSQRHKVHIAVSMSPGRSRRIIDPSLSPARMRRLLDPASPGRRRRLKDVSPIEIVQEEEVSVSVAQSHLSPTSPASNKECSSKTKQMVKTERSKLGTIEALCRQSMTFDLGVGLSIQDETGSTSGESKSQTLPISLSSSSQTSASSHSEIEGATGTACDKKTSRHKKFLDSAFIQKSKKFFKVSNNWFRLNDH